MQHQELAQLIEYIVIEPKDDQDPKRAFRYPFYACELLCCDNAKVIDSFFPSAEESEDETSKPDTAKLSPEKNNEDKANDEQISPEKTVDAPVEGQESAPIQENESTPEQAEESNTQEIPSEKAPEQPNKFFIIQIFTRVDLLTHFLSFIREQEGELNLVLAGYFSKVFQNLFSRRPEILLDRLFSDEQFLVRLLGLLHSRSIAEILTKLLIFEKELNLKDATRYLENKKQLLKQVISQLKENGEANFEIGANFLSLVTEMCQKAYTVDHGQELIQFLLATEQFGTLIELATHTSQNVSIPASSVLLQLLQLAMNDDLRAQDGDDSDCLQLDSKPALAKLSESYPIIFEFLNQVRPQLGQTRLKLVEIIHIVLRMKQEEPKVALASHNPFSAFNRLLELHTSNNLYHLQYHKITTTIIEQGLKPLIENIFVQNNLVEFLQKITLDCKPASRGQARKGYLGFVAKLGKFLEDYTEKNPELLVFLKVPQWEQFKKQFFSKAQRDNEKDLGGLVNNRDRGSSDAADFDFNRQDITNKYAAFLTDTSPSVRQEVQQEQPSNVCDWNQQFEQQTVNFGDFAGFGWSQPTAASNNEFAWDSIAKQPEPVANEQNSNQYWKQHLDNELERKALEEFEASLQ